VRVTGQLKSFHEKRHVGAHHIRPVQDHNEVIYHLLEATSIHLFNTRGPPGGTKQPASHNPGDRMDGIIAGGDSLGFQHNAQFDHLDPLHRRIMEFVHNAPSTNEGVHVQTIAQSIQAPSGSVLLAIEQLGMDGLLYTTIDDDHVLFNRTLANSLIGKEYDCRSVGLAAILRSRLSYFLVYHNYTAGTIIGMQDNTGTDSLALLPLRLYI
jgi:Replication protein A C terminal